FGLGDIDRIDSLVVYWPDGKQETLTEVAGNQSLRLLQENAAFRDSPETLQETYYTALNNNLGIDYKHEKTDVLDFRQDRLMPNAISNVGPKIIQGDFNGDGLQDIYLGGSKGVPGKLFQQRRDGTFVETRQQAFEDDKDYHDIDGVFLDADGDGFLDLYVVSGGNTYPENSPQLQ